MYRGKKMGLLIRGSLLVVTLLAIHLWIKQVMDTEEGNQKIEESLEVMNHSCAEFQGKISQARKYRHDIPKHLHTLEEAVSEIHDGKYCNDELLNTIAYIKAEKCMEQSINLKINFSIKEQNILTKLNMERVDFSGLIQNLLDNAIEECCRIPEYSKREIVWMINQTSKGIKIQVANTCSNIESIDFVTKKEDKKAHGWGVKIIKEIVHAAGGRIDYIKEEENRICAEVFLPFVKNN